MNKQTFEILKTCLLCLKKLNVCYTNTKSLFVVVFTKETVILIIQSKTNTMDANNDNNEITLLSFGGKYKYTLVMKYVSVWGNDNNDDGMNKLKKSKNCNQWIPFTSNENHPIHIGRDEYCYDGVRAVIGGSDNHLLFITYQRNNISVFNLNTFQFIKHETFPTNNCINYHCFILKSEHGQMKTNNKRSYEMLLFDQKTGLSIEYDEDNNNFQFRHIPVCKDAAPFNRYAYVCINDAILFFDGQSWKGNKSVASKTLHKYSIQKKTWSTFKHILPISLQNCFGILNEDNTHIHIIGGSNGKDAVSTHMKIKVREWIDSRQLVTFPFNTLDLHIFCNKYKYTFVLYIN
ncbi:hypothetical protein RFI_20747 [Reticulomyxa filosa]|uniref:Kelch motif family protein n=1 Tax=Reticulomyxa filosa TaxID=46433 RepID=X6MT15_RETFI|nr:hypothetical protein RFI_20747 [Reticulomyxa filosa]|eukprot:ETO16592.1 hypothetical protein RFI_20747 [Reticulomyxa filosa]